VSVASDSSLAAQHPARVKKDVHWVTQHPTHYNSLLFRTLARESALELTVHFMSGGDARHPWQTDFAFGFKFRTYKALIDATLLRVAAGKKPDFFVIGGWNDPTCAVLIHILTARGIPFAVWTDTPALGRRRSRFKATVRRKWVDHVLGLASYVLGTGAPALAALSHMGVPARKLVNFPFPVDLQLFRPSSRPSSLDGRTILVSSGRLVNSHKGFDIAIDALGLVRDRIGYCPFLLKVCGVGPDRKKLEHQVAALRLGDSVEFVGWLEPSQMPIFLAGAHLYLHPSRFDPFPNAVLEAMACGLAVVGSDHAGSVLDRVEHGINGLVFPMGDSSALAELLIAAHQDRDRLALMGTAARRTAEAWPVAFNVDQILRLVCGQIAQPR
jgi:glycosyltransferase involved in cell wall biosynthesis